MTKPAFLITVRNKQRMIYKSVMSALAQTYPCDIYVSDGGSTDDTPKEIERALAESSRFPRHTITRMHPKLSEVKCGLRILNEHLMWCFNEIPNEWIFHCSGDDWSLPERVSACMELLKTHKASAVATPQYHLPEGAELGGEMLCTAAPHLSGYLSPADGITKLGFGSCIAGYKRSFLMKVGSPGLATPDIFWGYLAALDEGYLVVPEPLHVHTDAASPENNGFGGRLLAAEKKGDAVEIAQLSELNHFQLLGHYYESAIRQEALYPKAPGYAKEAVIRAIISHAIGWYRERVKLHSKGVEPISMNTCDVRGMEAAEELRRQAVSH